MLHVKLIWVFCFIIEQCCNETLFSFWFCGFVTIVCCPNVVSLPLHALTVLTVIGNNIAVGVIYWILLVFLVRQGCNKCTQRYICWINDCMLAEFLNKLKADLAIKRIDIHIGSVNRRCQWEKHISVCSLPCANNWMGLVVSLVYIHEAVSVPRGRLFFLQ